MKFKNIISIFILASLLLSPVVSFGATTSPAKKVTTVKKQVTKKAPVKKKVAKKQKVIANPPRITVATAPHSPKPVAKKKAPAKKVVTPKKKS